MSSTVVPPLPLRTEKLKPRWKAGLAASITARSVSSRAGCSWAWNSERASAIWASARQCC